MRVNKISGYLIVRKPMYSFDKEGRGVFESIPLHLGNIYYGGIERMPWFELEEAFYSNKLNVTLVDSFKLLNKSNEDFSGILLSQDIEETKRILDFSNHSKVLNEIIVVYSDQLSKIKGSIREPSTVNWLGYEPFSLGNWSLLKEGLFRNPTAFEEWKQKINNNGLFSQIDEAQAYIDDYIKKSLTGVVEEISYKQFDLDILKVGVIN